MATFKNRALTLATLGALSGSVLSLGTLGVLQERTAVVEPPVTEVPARAGGAGRVGERFLLEFPRLHEHVSPLQIELFFNASFDHQHELPKTFQQRATLDLFLFGDVRAHISALFTAKSSLDIVVESSLTAEQHAVVRTASAIGVTLGSTAFARLTHAGSFDYAQAGRIDITGEAVTSYTRAITAHDERDYAHVAVSTGVQPSAVVTFTKAPRPTILPARDYAQRSTLVLDITGEAHKENSAEKTHAVFFASTHSIALTGAATYSTATAASHAIRYEATQVIGITGGSISSLRSDVLPHADEDDEILVLFAKMMNEIDA
jgi:hypothetical protein